MDQLSFKASSTTWQSYNSLAECYVSGLEESIKIDVQACQQHFLLQLGSQGYMSHKINQLKMLPY